MTIGMNHVIGIDAGGTKTLFGVAGLTGGMLHQEKTGPGNINSAGDAFLESLASGLRAVAEAGYPPERCGGLCIGAAGAGDAAVSRLLKEELNRLGYARVLAVTDAHTALRGALGGEDGIICIAGTGSIVYGVNGDKSCRCGGWGHVISDIGSGYWIGLEIMRRVMESYDGVRPETALTGLLLEELGIGDPTGLISFVYRQGKGKKDIAALAPLADAACRKGDRVASEILEEGARRLFLDVEVAARRLELPAPVKVAAYGGIFERGEFTGPLFKSLLEEHGFTAVDPAGSAVDGAIWEARRLEAGRERGGDHI